MNIKETFEKRRSHKDFDANLEITDEDLNEIFDLVKLSPSGYNLQPWEFIVIREKENKKKLRKMAYDQKQVEEASAAIIVACNLSKSKSAEKVFDGSIKLGELDQNTADKWIKNFEDQESGMSEQDKIIWAYRSANLASMSFMLAAESFGWQTGPMEGFDFNKVREEFMTKNYYPVMLIVIGKAIKDMDKRQFRRSFEEIVHFEKLQ